jgi:hypothetical protein
MRTRTLLSSASLAAALAMAADAATTSVAPIEHTVEILGDAATITVTPSLSIDGEPGRWTATLEARIDASEIQSALRKALPVVLEDNHCGSRTKITHGKIRPVGDRLKVTARLDYEHFTCPPRLFGFPIGGGFYTLRQGAQLVAHASLAFGVTDIGIQPQMGPVDVEGLIGRTLVGVAVEILAQNRLQAILVDAASKARVDLPEAFARLGMTITTARFVDLGDGRLGVEVSAAAEMSEALLLELLDEAARR